MANNNILDIIMRFVVDKNSQKTATDSLTKLGIKWDEAAKKFRNVNTGKVISDQLAEAYKEVGALIDAVAEKSEKADPKKFAAGGQQMVESYRRATAEILQAYEAQGKLAEGLNEIRGQIASGSMAMDQPAQDDSTNNIANGMSGYVLSSAGEKMNQFTQSIFSLSQGYVERAGMTSAASQRWLNATNEIQKSTDRIGKTLVEQIAPVLERAADVVKAIADYAEKNPGIAKATAYTAVGGYVGSKALEYGGGAIVIYNALKQLGLIGGKTAAGAATGGTAAKFMTGAGPVGIAAAANVGLQYGLYKLISSIPAVQSIRKTEAQTVTLGANALFGPEVARKVGELTGAIEKMGNSAEQTAGKVGDNAAAVDAFIAYRKEEADAEEQYSQERNDIVSQYAQERVDLEANYEKSRTSIIQDAARSAADAERQYQQEAAKMATSMVRAETQAEEDYYANRLKASKEYSLTVQRMEEDHQRKMAQMAAEHNQRVADLTDQRDALGLWREMRDYETKRKAEEETYQIEARRRSEDFALRMAEMEQEFAVSRQRRLQDYQQQRADADAEYQQRRADAAQRLAEQLADLDANHKAELVQLEKQKAEKLVQLDATYKQEQAKRRTAFNDQLRDLDAALLNETNQKSAWYSEQSRLLQEYIDQWQGQFTSALPGYGTAQAVPQKLAGGYVSAGLYRMHDDEFVMTKATAQVAERMAGGKLTQAALVSLMAGTRGMQQNITVNGVMDQRMERKIERVARRGAYQGLTEAFG